MVDVVGQPDGVRHHAHIEGHFGRIRFLLSLPEALHKSRSKTADQRLREAKFQNAKQNEQEIHGHRAFYARESDLKARSKNGDEEIASKTGKISALPVSQRGCQHYGRDGDRDGDEYFGPSTHASPSDGTWLFVQLPPQTPTCNYLGFRVECQRLKRTDSTPDLARHPSPWPSWPARGDILTTGGSLSERFGGAP